MMVASHFTICVPPVTKKNSIQLVKMKGRTIPLPSKKYKDYEIKALKYCPGWQINHPVNIEAHYYMATRRRVDITNLESALMDLLVKAGTIKDDNCSIVVSTDGSRVHYDKDNPRTEVHIYTVKDADPEFLRG